MKSLSGRLFLILIFYHLTGFDAPFKMTSPPAEGLTIWFKADEGVIHNKDGAVSKWTDQSGNDIHAIQNTDSLRPGYVQNVVNGKPVVRFKEQLKNQMEFSFHPDGLTQLTIVIVSANTKHQCHPRYGCENSLSNHGTLFSPVSWQQDGRWGTTYVTPLQNTISVRFGTGENENVNVYHRDPPVGDAFSVTTAEHNGHSEILYVNGKKVMAWAVGKEVLANNREVGYLGKARAKTYFNGDIAEVLIYDKALSESELKTLHVYLKSKYFSDN